MLHRVLLILLLFVAGLASIATAFNCGSKQQLKHEHGLYSFEPKLKLRKKGDRPCYHRIRDVNKMLPMDGSMISCVSSFIVIGYWAYYTLISEYLPERYRNWPWGHMDPIWETIQKEVLEKIGLPLGMKPSEDDDSDVDFKRLLRETNQSHHKLHDKPDESLQLNPLVTVFLGVVIAFLLLICIAVTVNGIIRSRRRKKKNQEYIEAMNETYEKLHGEITDILVAKKIRRAKRNEKALARMNKRVTPSGVQTAGQQSNTSQVM